MPVVCCFDGGAGDDLSSCDPRVGTWTAVPFEHGHEMSPAYEASRWFSSIDSDLPDSARLVLSEIVRMLERAQPTRLDRSRSSVRSAGHGWNLGSRTVVITLGNAANAEWDIEVVVADDEAIVAWLGAHEHVERRDGSAERPWTTVVVDALAGVLAGDYEVESHYRGAHLVKTRIVDVSGDQRRVLSTTGVMTALIPFLGKKRIEATKVDFGTQPRQAGD